MCLSSAVVSSSLRQYHFVDQKKTWTEAQRYCRENHTDLVTINDMQEQNDIKQLLNSNSERVWIGLRSTDTWIWSLSDPASYRANESQYRNWSDNQPQGDGDCVYMDCGNGQKGQWHDAKCTEALHFICYNDSSKEFVPVMEEKTWTDAQKYCRQYHTDLASVKNQSENDQIQNIITSTKQAWIGLHRLWVWSDNSTSTFTHWKPGEPNENNNRHNICTSIDIKHYPRQWTDEKCSEEYPFVCYDDKLVLIRENKTWTEALRHCRNNDMDLVSVDSEQMQQRVKMSITKANVSDHVWLGLRHSSVLGIWFWVNGQTVCYDQWAPDYNKDLNKCDTTVRTGAIRTSDNKWISRPETDTYNFICSK
ncbi:C-type mannose receptor 2-like isoform X1 [Labeo rohita]|uniref:C-type mannose receptor 2-like isoform X1 n=2 Tax=Labeo rohita TaxID=84645 RepID=UPI0021E2004F|nr:C-type mannose receptor 2-like isoform X1 [Labeo rohita]